MQASLTVDLTILLEVFVDLMKSTALRYSMCTSCWIFGGEASEGFGALDLAWIGRLLSQRASLGDNMSSTQA